MKWFTNYLSGRKQVVSCNGVLSEKREMKIGVPQGSTLGPTLFLVFINDIITSLKSARCCIFADDVVLYVSHKNLDLATVTLQNSLNELYKWYKNNRLKINVDKTKVMLLKSSSSDKLNIFIENHQIEQVKSIRYLGVEVDENLSWKQHIDKLCKSLSFKIHSLGLLRKYLDARLLNILYKTIIQSCTDYCCSVWGNCCISYKSGLVRLQKRAARFVTGNFDFLTTHGLDLMKELSWQSLEQRRDYFLATLMFKCIHGHAPNRLCQDIEMVFDRHGMNTRNANSLKVTVPKPNLECFKRSFRYAGAQVWNNLPEELQNAQSLSSFKMLYKRSYLQSNLRNK